MKICSILFQGMGIITLTAGISFLRPLSCNQNSKSECTNLPKSWQLGVLFAGLGLLSIGAGGIRPCNIAFGADQFDTRTEKGKAQLQSFFNWWYFTFTIALVVALTGVVYIQTNVSWTLGFAIPTACLGISIAIFLLGYHTYINVKPRGSIFSDTFKVITAAYRKRRVEISHDNRAFYDPPVTDSELKLPHTDRYRCLDKAAMITTPDELNGQGVAKNGWRLCSVQQVEQLKCLIAVLPVGVSGVGALMTMDQNTTFGILQALQMNRSIGKNHFMFPPGWMNIVSMVTLSIWIYVYERIYIPQARKVTGTRDKRLSMKQRIKIGLVMSILSMIVSGIVEIHRRNSALKQDSFISPASVALLFPQFSLTGLTEAFAAVAIMEFLTLQLGENMRTVAGAMFFLCISIASYAGSILVNVIHSVTKISGKSPWLGGHDLNKNRLDYYYFFLAALAGLNLVYFHFFASHHVLTSSPDCETRDQGHDFATSHSRNPSE